VCGTKIHDMTKGSARDEWETAARLANMHCELGGCCHFD